MHTYHMLNLSTVCKLEDLIELRIHVTILGVLVTGPAPPPTMDIGNR